MGAIKLLHVTNALGIGGQDRNIETICQHLRMGFSQYVAALFRTGPRARHLEANGVPIWDLRGSLPRMRDLVRSHGIDAILLHRAGKAEPNWSTVLRECKAGGVKAAFEYNVFGLLDMSPEDNHIDVHFHKSKTSYLQFLERARNACYKRIERHRVLYNAVNTERFAQLTISHEERGARRAALGITPEDFVLLRVGRPDVRKWSDFLLAAIPHIFARVPNATILLMTAPPSRIAWIKRQPWRDRIRMLENTSADRELVATYQIADVLAHSSRRGETFPNTVLEAFSVGVPAVVNATPWRDNSQIEMVDHMVNGIVANTPGDYAEAIAFLAGNRRKLVEMGRNARLKVQMYSADKVTRSLGRLVVDTLQAKGCAVNDQAETVMQWQVYPSDEELKQYPDEYTRRLALAWSPKVPEMGGSAVGRLYWFSRDAFEVLRYRYEKGSWWM